MTIYNRDQTVALRNSVGQPGGITQEHYDRLASTPGMLDVPLSASEEAAKRQAARDAEIAAAVKRQNEAKDGVEKILSTYRQHISITSGLSEDEISVLTDADLIAIYRADNVNEGANTPEANYAAARKLMDAEKAV